MHSPTFWKIGLKYTDSTINKVDIWWSKMIKWHYQAKSRDLCGWSTVADRPILSPTHLYAHFLQWVLHSSSLNYNNHSLHMWSYHWAELITFNWSSYTYLQSKNTQTHTYCMHTHTDSHHPTDFVKVHIDSKIKTHMPTHTEPHWLILSLPRPVGVEGGGYRSLHRWYSAHLLEKWTMAVCKKHSGPFPTTADSREYVST